MRRNRPRLSSRPISNSETTEPNNAPSASAASSSRARRSDTVPEPSKYNSSACVSARSGSAGIDVVLVERVVGEVDSGTDNIADDLEAPFQGAKASLGPERKAR